MCNKHYAWGDESVRVQGPGSSQYLIGVCLCDKSESDIRAAFKDAHLIQGPKVHWRDMNVSERKRSIKLINSMHFTNLVVSAGPITGAMRPERARRKCLEKLIPALEHDYGITHLRMEARSSKQDMEEMAFMQHLHERGFLDTLRYKLLPGSQDARLWIPDQILGAIGGIDAGITMPIENVKRDSIEL
ncbi:hypothetical protein OZX67_08490 [Bifidobacterium sp. ESL0728]|uniref:hypothetical protein n=1 Tax=Bifidobacterium sp. ESL0728 TaxID=2983220 RepID=UPI0023F85F63|nr:hypothetical protein [Bifidobacterium sp. ESL0728]WEV58815.1 hypothetical protein OZX67_08490 [Bifidobacterium sp. ESL0728]